MGVCFLSALSACGGAPSDPQALSFEAEGKLDVSTPRPLGTFAQRKKSCSWTSLTLNPDKTQSYSQQLCNCSPGSCTDAHTGRYRWASSHGDSYVVLYEEDGSWAYALDYVWSPERPDQLVLSYAAGDTTFTLTRRE
jgi:hypothetical protein